ncbi:MAG: DUF2478 domain-containing protein [Alsobacter sp.]
MASMRGLPDADSEIVALVYEPGQRPDFLLAAFAGEQRRRGLRVVGLVQTRGLVGSRPIPGLVMLDTGAWRAIDHARRGDDSCRPAEEAFATAAESLARSVAAGADLVIVNRFGRLEAEGRGFWPVIEAAHRCDTPLVVAVPRANLTAWLDWSGGMCAALPCQAAALQAWWASRRPAGTEPPDTRPELPVRLSARSGLPEDPRHIVRLYIEGRKDEGPIPDEPPS